jgi:FMN phosphatase YigB (HAD superfamily)
MTKIEFVYFDIGGVLLLDFTTTNKWIELKRDLGVKPELDAEFDKVWQKYEARVCLDYDVDNMVFELAKISGIKIPQKYSLLDDFINRFEKNHSIWPVVKKASQKYKVGLLTNMYPRMLSLIEKNRLIPNINWNAVVDSSKVGFQKPEDGIFKTAENMAGFKRHEILFIENSKQHVEAAKKLGWNTLLYNTANPVLSSKKVEQVLQL